MEPIRRLDWAFIFAVIGSLGVAISISVGMQRNDLAFITGLAIYFITFPLWIIAMEAQHGSD